MNIYYFITIKLTTYNIFFIYTLKLFDVHRSVGPCIAIYFYSKTEKMRQFHKLIVFARHSWAPMMDGKTVQNL
jgi:hypothetical protein